MPKIERIVMIPSVNEQVNAQALISNDFDYYGSLQPATWATVFKGNPEGHHAFASRRRRFGYQDWWPCSLYVNCERAPFSNPDVAGRCRTTSTATWSVDVGWSGAAEPIEFIMPDYPGPEAVLRRDQAAARRSTRPTSSTQRRVTSSSPGRLQEGLERDLGRLDGQAVQVRDHHDLELRRGWRRSSRSCSSGKGVDVTLRDPDRHERSLQQG
jgi:hypothetical protein